MDQQVLSAAPATMAGVPETVRRGVIARAAMLCANDPAMAAWAAGRGPIRHDPLTQLRVHALVNALLEGGQVSAAADAWQRLRAADILACAGLWLVGHLTYARRVWLDGRPLAAADFKDKPEGHTGGALNMVPAYAAYLALNALDGHTRGWLMGQGHCVAAIDALNVLVGNTTPEHAARYPLDDAGLSRLVADFYSYAQAPDGRPGVPLGSHVNAHTAGGMQEGGYLGFAELHYVHAPLPGERLVAFLSDGAFEEQRGSDWAPRWWRASDSGLVAPLMILNGRRIEQRTQIDQQGGEDWLVAHLKLNGFDPVRLDGTDPASLAWGLWWMEQELTRRGAAGGAVALPYGLARTVKGWGFPGAGSNRAHNLPLAGHPAHDLAARAQFQAAVNALHVPEAELRTAVATLHTHARQRRPRERDHVLAHRHPPAPLLPEPQWRDSAAGPLSPMTALDTWIVQVVDANPGLRPRVGNPDELSSNRLDATLARLKHRVAHPEPGVAEALDGGVITALNEEAVICAALGNKGGLNLAVTYEAFGAKMLGALRQELTFARQLRDAGPPPGWLSVPLVLTSHTWENAKNEISHQDPTLVECLLGEMADGVSVQFPVDANSALAMLGTCWCGRGRLHALVVPKQPQPVRLDPAQARLLAKDGVLCISGDPTRADVLLLACGAYQCGELMRTAERLAAHSVRTALLLLGEPGRLRTPRDATEAAWVHTDARLADWFPASVPRVLLSHTRPEPLLGALRRIDTGPATTRALGYANRGGTFDVQGLLFANRCTWAHALEAVAQVLGRPLDAWLSAQEHAAVQGRGDPGALRQA